MRDLKFTGRSSAGGWLRDLLILALVLGIPFIQYLGGLPLIDPDEGRYAEIPREMLERGDLVTPTLNYVKYFEKPPLLYWINAASLKLLGEHEFAARFPSAICGLLTVLATYIIGRRLYGRRTGLLAAAMLGTSVGFVLQSRIILTDMLLTLCLTGALGAFIIAAQREGKRSQDLPWYLFYLFCALATLAKGLIGMVFPAGIVFWYLLVSKRWRVLREMRLATGLLFFLAVAAPWFVLVSLRNPEFARFFFIHEHFERFTSTVHGRYQPFWFFVPVLLATMLPWSMFIPGSVVRAWRDRHFEEGKGGLFLTVWMVVIFLFFSKSNSKLIPYILPIFPPLAILIASRFDALLEGRGREIKSAALLTGMVSLLVGAAFVGYGALPQVVELAVSLVPSQAETLKRFVTTLPPLGVVAPLVLGGLFLVQGVGCTAGAGRNPRLVAATLCLCSFLLAIAVPRLMLGVIAQAESSRELAVKIREKLTPETQVVTFGPVQGIPWYLKRRVMTTGELDELTFGSGQGDQSLWFPRLPQLVERWNSGAPMLLVLKKRELQALQPSLAIAPQLLLTSGRRLLVTNR